LDDINKKHTDIDIKVLHAETGNVTESDVMLAAASNAVILGFAVDADAASRRLAESEGVSIRLYKIIYRLLEDVEKAMQGLLEPEMVEKVIGRASVLAIFKVSKGGTAAGCRVTMGELRRNSDVHLIRNNEVIVTAEIATIKREKEEVRDVREGMECGITLKGFEDFMVGDTLECFVMEKFGS
jgi:translation initiation factor IF-2